MNNVLLKKISKAVVKEIQALEEQASDQGVEEIISEIETPPEVEKKFTGEDPQQAEEPQEKQQQSTISPKDLKASKEILQKHKKLVVNITDFIEQYKEGEWEDQPIKDVIDLAQDTIQEDLKGEIQKFAASKKWNEVIPLMNKLVGQRYIQLLQIKKQGAGKPINIKGYLQPMVAFVKAYNQLNEIINKLSEQPPEQPEEKPTDVKDTPVEDMYDPSDEDREMLRSAYNAFKEEFYQVRKMVQQGQLIQLLINQLSKIQKEETEDSYQKVDEILNEEEKQRVKKELENVKTDFRSFYQELLSTRDLLQKAGKEAKAGKLNFNIVKKEFLQQLQKIQDDILEIYSDLVNLSPPKAEVEEIPESQQFLEQEEEKDDRLSRAKKIQAVYNEITKSIGPIVNILSQGESFPESRMLPAVKAALDKLNKIVDFFPSVKAFSGQTGSFEELKEKYTKMIRNLGYLNDNFQRLIKDESVSSTAINNLYLGLKKFSKEMEDTFGVESKIIDKPKPTDPDAEATTPEAEDTGSDGEDNDGDEQEKKETELRSISKAETFIKNKIFPLNNYMKIFDDNPEAQGFAEDSRDVLGLFLALSKARQEVNEQEEVAMGQESLSRVITILSKIFNVPKTKTEYIINQQLRKIVPNKLKTLSQFLTMVREKGRKSELVRLARFIQNKIKAFPFAVTADPSQLMRKFDIEDSKTKPQKSKEPQLAKEQKLSKLLKPLIEKILREQ